MTSQHFYYLLTFWFIASLNCKINNDLAKPDLIETLPQVEIETFSEHIQDSPKINAQMLIFIEEEIRFSGNIAIEIRGSSSQRFPKKSYGFETRDIKNEDLDVSLLGFPEEEDWILHGPYSDKTLIRNKLVYDLSRSIGNYTSRTAFVDLAINNEYQGLYVLMEKLKRDKNRIDISKLTQDDVMGEELTGGYILKIDRAVEDNPDAFFTSIYPPPSATRGQQVTFVFEEPKADEITTEQKNYIIDYITSFENSLKSTSFNDPINGYRSYVNVSSFIDFFIISELTNNVDAYRLSSFLTKDKNGKLNMGPVWDFNYALGNVDFCDAGRTDIWAYTFNERCGNHNQQVPFWWSRFLEDPIFVEKLKNRWSKLRSNELTTTNIHNKIDNYSALLQQSGAIKRNFEVWDILGVDVHPNNFIGDTHQQEIDYLKEWIEARLEWLDSSITEL